MHIFFVNSLGLKPVDFLKNLLKYASFSKPSFTSFIRMNKKSLCFLYYSVVYDYHINS